MKSDDIRVRSRSRIRTYDSRIRILEVKNIWFRRIRIRNTATNSIYSTQHPYTFVIVSSMSCIMGYFK
jgi:hypothetical protein